MVNLAYNLSPHLTQNLNKIDSLEAKILLQKISREDELRLKWDAALSRIYWSLALDDLPQTKSEIQNAILVSSQKLPPNLKRAQNYKRAFDFVSQKWFLNPDLLTAKTVRELFRLIYPEGSLRLNYEEEGEINHFLNYLHSGSEHPVLQAGIAYIELKAVLKSAGPETDTLPRMLVYLQLAKHGTTFRELLVFEEFIKKDKVGFEQFCARSIESSKLTLWLEYFTGIIALQLEHARTKILETETLPKFVRGLKLTERQTAILNSLENPEQTITNRKVQQQFKVSQITASRDLSRLASLGLLYPHGQGRSIYYSKI